MTGQVYYTSIAGVMIRIRSVTMRVRALGDLLLIRKVCVRKVPRRIWRRELIIVRWSSATRVSAHVFRLAGKKLLSL